MTLRFAESILIGIPLTHIFLLLILIFTHTDRFFMPDEGQILTGTVLEGTRDLATAKTITELNVTNQFSTLPFDTNTSGPLTVLTVAGSSIEFIKRMINLEISFVRTPLKNVAGGTGAEDNRADFVLFNSLFFAFFVLPSYVLMGFAILFFARSG